MINDNKCHFRVIKSSILESIIDPGEIPKYPKLYNVKYVCGIERLDIKFEEIISNEDYLQGSSTINGVGEF